ncbi:hypothetical protein BHM03_00038184 [Ensete ventricosum]|nr:hypothetical protein BHM03_00038184 [Ensete ventricosum]
MRLNRNPPRWVPPLTQNRAKTHHDESLLPLTQSSQDPPRRVPAPTPVVVPKPITVGPTSHSLSRTKTCYDGSLLPLTRSSQDPPRRVPSPTHAVEPKRPTHVIEPRPAMIGLSSHWHGRAKSAMMGPFSRS